MSDLQNNGHAGPDAEQASKTPGQVQMEVLRLLSDSTDDYLYSLDLSTNQIYFPGSIWKKFALMEPGEHYCTIEDWLGLVYERDLPALQADLEQIRLGNQLEHNLDYRMLDRNGNRVWVSCRGQCQLDKDGHPIRMFGRVSDTSLSQKIDPLTGVFNANQLPEDMESILASGNSCFLLLIGLDNLKSINLRHGRSYGNSLLQLVADSLEELVEARLRVYRLNGDCFAVNLPASEEDSVRTFFDRVRKRLAEYCTISAGAVAYHSHPYEDVSSLYQYAEETLDRAKRMGKDTLAFFSQKDYEEKLSTIELQEELRQSIQNGFAGFSLCYQPQMHSHTYDLFGAEALLRFFSPTRGPVSPSEFIPVLEQTGMICPVGLWLLEVALTQCRAWQAHIPQMHISVNISYVQLAQDGIARKVLEILERSGLGGKYLTLEVTESMQLQDYSRFNKIFYRWKAAGIEISVDDFGTGYSSLSYLKGLEIDEIKIDRCFVRGVQHSAYNYRLLSNLVELAHSSQIRVCCEGVETSEELAVLENLHSDLLQGFLFGRPYTTEAFERHFLLPHSSEYQTQQKLHEKLRSLRWSQEQLPEDLLTTPKTLEEVLDAIDDIIYVSDLTTYELYYLNPAGRRLTGVYDYQGQKCYKVLQGKSDPCEFCTNDLLKKGRFYVWECQNQFFNRRFILKDKLISWHDRPARMEIAIDVSEHEFVSQDTQEKLDFAQNILACAQVLAAESDMEQATNRMLALVGDFYQADRAYIFEPDSTEEGSWSNTYEWCRPGITPQQAALQNLPSLLLQRWLDLFSQGQSVIIGSVEDLQESSPDEWKMLADQGIHRMIAVPFARAGLGVSFLGVDNPRHCASDDSQIRMLTLFLSSRFRHNEAEERLGELLNLHYQDILKNTELGLWFIRQDPSGSRHELFADETMCRILGLDRNLSPVDCYNHWYSHIHDGYYQYVSLAIENMIHSGKVVQLEYPWEHPTLGEVMVRCTGVRAADRDGLICLEGYHRMISDVERTRFLPETPSGEVFEFNERKGTIYFHTKRELLAGGECHEGKFPQCWLDAGLVHPHFAQRFRSFFQNVSQAQDLDGQELLLRSKQGNYEWFKLRTHHLGSEAQDRDTILVLLDPADQERVLELENMRLRDFYQASLSESVAYAEVDLESRQIRTAGGIWSGYEKKTLGKDVNIIQFMLEQAKASIRQCPWEHSDCEDWGSLLSSAPDTQRVRYQRLLDGEWHWVELIVHSFREQFSENVYALLYLKDIDTQMRRELAQQNAARRDPLTGVYNRLAFQSEVEHYMADPETLRCGAMVLLDIDDFKAINDHYGHLEGDEALKHVTALLRSTFRSQDLVGRLGGDEFMVFIKGVVQKSTLNRRMDQLFSALRENETLPLTCSAGIALVNSQSSSSFSYETCIYRADKALYESKQLGKNLYCYAPDGQDPPV